MSGSANGHSEQQTYWNQLVLVKVAACYVRRYRDEQARWINWIGIFKALVTSSTIGAWAIWKDYAFAWAVLIGIVQPFGCGKGRHATDETPPERQWVCLGFGKHHH